MPMRIGGSEDPGLDRFQALRALALRRMEGLDERLQAVQTRASRKPAASAFGIGPTSGTPAGAQSRAPAPAPGKHHLGQVLDILA